MNVKNFFLLGIVPILVTAFSWLSRSMLGLPGYLIVITGLGGWLISILLRFSIRRLKLYDTWWANLFTGLAGCALVFVIILIYASLNG